MIDVVHLITGLDIGGAELMLVRLLAHMDRTRFRSTVVSMTGRGALADRIEALQVPVITLGMRHGVPSPLAVTRLASHLRAARPVVLQTWLYHADLLGYVAGRLAHVPAIVWNIRCGALRPQHHPVGLWWTVKVLARLSPHATAVVVNARAGQEESERLGYHPRRWVLIENGFELDQFVPSAEARDSVRRELGVGAETPLVGLVARFHPMKDHATFLRAAARLLQQRSDVVFVLAGRQVDDANPELRGMIGELGLRSSLRLLGERTDIPRLTAAFDVATCCSYAEGFPNAIGEAMACAVPCVTTDVGDCARVVGDTGWVVPARDPAALAAAWADVLSLSSERRHDAGIRARARVTECFDIQSVVRRYEDLYAELSGEALARTADVRH